MDRVSDGKGKQTILEIVVDKEKSTFENLAFKVVEHEQGIISDTTIKKIKALIDEIMYNINKTGQESIVKNDMAIITLIYDVENIAVNLEIANFIKDIENYHKITDKILRCAEMDLSISVI